ncbi:hypothetical protein QMK19_25795 [Streptomyces sp. H10-C2]|uniref:hypothetical protein n=1 Tax=unclassified Streptomyces TaxID=2593676 RepID=UPI0024B9B009|nr:MULTISPECIES: hypothetical protein [unclassified Streptomyces]MDJ0346048.1 hypothetical protein [Streptomyces sp. PH10-H1]MDJ0372976.1 hypothetical protein [Streptomyces sp. H10-C2]
MPAKQHVTLGIVLGGLGLAVAAALTMPQVVDWYQGRHVEEAGYASGSKAKAARESVPRWLPDEATAVKYRMSTKGGDRLLKATLADGKLPAGCTRGAGNGRAHLRADWFPKGTDKEGTAACGAYNVVLKGTDLYAWQDHADWVKAKQAGSDAP